MHSSHEKALHHSAGKEYKKGTTKGDLIAHKRSNLRQRFEKHHSAPYRSDYKLFGKGPER